MNHEQLDRLIEVEDRRDWSAAALEAYRGMKVFFVLWAALNPVDYHSRTRKARGRARITAWRLFSERYLAGETVGGYLGRLHGAADLAEASALKARVIGDAEKRARFNGLSLADEIDHYIERREGRLAEQVESAA